MAGVLQGSILGPLLFLVYINDRTADLKCHGKLFADDTSLFTVVQESTAADEDMNHDLTMISKWAHDWRMSFNPDSQKQSCRTTAVKERHKIDYPVILFNNIPVKKVSEHKHLGVVLDSKLFF